jgi:glutamate-1-semialdehyde 2,1-aminomutase
MIDRQHLKTLLAQELRQFEQTHPRSKALYQQAKAHLHDGVPMSWMVRWAGSFPLFVQEARGSHFTDADGKRYLDLCLGDTAAMTGHAPAPVLQAATHRIERGSCMMLPTEDSLWVSQELARRFGLPYWQFALTATDANRFAIRLARHITGRKLILVFNWCYHGTVDETFITLERGRPKLRDGNIGAGVDPTQTTRVVEFNDLAALEAALADHQVACVLTEPALTNIGIVHPQPGFHEALREITRRTGTLLIMDETHTISTSPGGYTQAHHLKPDIVTLGKPIGGGIPAAVYGFSAEIAERIRRRTDQHSADTSGIGGTLAGNPLSLAAVRATLEHVLTPQAYKHTTALARRFAEGVSQVIKAEGLPWHVTQLGCRAEYWFIPRPPRNGGEAAAAIDPDLDRYMHLAALNRGILMTPFHNMALIAPTTTAQDIDWHTEVFRQSVAALLHPHAQRQPAQAAG